MLTGAHLRRNWLAGSALCLALLTTAGVAHADDRPKFKAGLWEFERSIDGAQGGPQSLKAQKCTDPTQFFDGRAQIPGCTMSPMTRSGNSYRFTAQCTMQGSAMTSTTVVVADSDSAYTQTVESQIGAQKTKEVLVAKRVGECKP